MRISNRADAHKARMSHEFIPGLGYINHGSEPPIPAGTQTKKPVLPKKGTAEGSLHRLLNAGTGKTEMRWKDGHWEHPHAPLTKGKRIAFSPAFLGRAGWSYIKAI